MIDYEKLKLAMSLAEKLDRHHSIQINIVSGVLGTFAGVMRYAYKIEKGDYSKDIVFAHLEHFIHQLEELVKPEPKYKPNDVVFYLNDDTVCWFVVSIASWCQENNEFMYGYHGDFSYRESYLFPTRQALIEHQLQYWQKLYNEALDDDGIYQPETQLNESQDVDRCSHESDGNIYTSCPPQNKCIKCGEFYR